LKEGYYDFVAKKFSGMRRLALNYVYPEIDIDGRVRAYDFIATIYVSI